MSELAAALPDLVPDDVVGSAYCVRDYAVDPHLGGDHGLAVARAALADRGVRLVLDFVPNHVAVDHPWTTEHPEYFVQGDELDLESDPASFVRVGGRVLACGRDPYFPAWTDVVQLDASRPDVRAAAAGVVGAIARRCDGVRCDMAMLMLDDVFDRTWAGRARAGPSRTGVGATGRTSSAPSGGASRLRVLGRGLLGDPSRVLAAGFRRLLRQGSLRPAGARRAGVVGDAAVLGGPPGATAPGPSALRRTTTSRGWPLCSRRLRPEPPPAVTSTTPGVALVHHGQSEGRRIRIPVQLGRAPHEPVEAGSVEWYGRLMAAIGDGMRRGRWAPAAVEGWPDNRSCERLVAWTWTTDRFVDLVVVNLGDDRADGRVAGSTVRRPAPSSSPIC